MVYMVDLHTVRVSQTRLGC